MTSTLPIFLRLSKLNNNVCVTIIFVHLRIRDLNFTQYLRCYFYVRHEYVVYYNDYNNDNNTGTVIVDQILKILLKQCQA